MNDKNRAAKVQNLIHTSAEDCRIDLANCYDSVLLCDLLIEVNRHGHKAREQIVRRRISKLIGKKNK